MRCCSSTLIQSNPTQDFGYSIEIERHLLRRMLRIKLEIGQTRDWTSAASVRGFDTKLRGPVMRTSQSPAMI
jgi:hypothetical protein